MPSQPALGQAASKYGIWSNDQAKAEAPGCPQPGKRRSTLNENDWTMLSGVCGLMLGHTIALDPVFPRYIDVL